MPSNIINPISTIQPVHRNPAKGCPPGNGHAGLPRTRLTPSDDEAREIRMATNCDSTAREAERVDPATELMLAMEEYKRKSGRKFPTWSEVLEVIKSLGYDISRKEETQ